MRSVGCGSSGPMEYRPWVTPNGADLLVANLASFGSNWIFREVITSDADTAAVERIKLVY